MSDRTCAGQSTRSAQTFQLFGCNLNSRRKAIQASMNQKIILQWVLQNEEGQPIDLTSCGDFDPDDPTTGAVKITIAESVLAPSGPVLYAVTGTVTSAETGVVEFDVGTDATNVPGIFLAEAAVFNGDGDIVFVNQFYLVVNRGITGLRLEQNGPPSIAEIRLHLRDSDAKENELLEAVQFDLAEIALAIERPILYWNETPPPISQRYTTDTFPFRYHWLEAIVGQLYMMAAHWYRRNQMPYQAGNVSVDDMNKSQEYEQIGQLRWKTYREWVLQTKVRMNAEAAIQSQFSGYSYGKFW